jgi:hypothetical protein
VEQRQHEPHVPQDPRKGRCRWIHIQLSRPVPRYIAVWDDNAGVGRGYAQKSGTVKEKNKKKRKEKKLSFKIKSSTHACPEP